jgi:YidC/Oxa1 family membrane protein insertase
MNMDRNSVIGFILLAVLLFVYLFVSTKESQQLQMQQRREQDSLARVQRLRDSITLSKDTARAVAQTGKDTSSTGFRLKSSEEWAIMENDLIKVYFTNKGGQPHKVELKKYASFRDSTVVLGGSDFDKFGYMVRVDGNNALPVSDLYFAGSGVQKMSDGSQQISYTAVGGSGEKITHTFTLRSGQYLMDWVARFSGVTQLFKEGGFHLTWQSRPLQQESDAIYERQMTNICFLEDNSFDYIQSKSEKTFEKPVKWVSVSQQFFNTTLIAASPFTSGELKMVKAADTSRAIADVTTVLHATLPQGNEAAVSMQLFYGPNDYDILRKLPVEDMDKIINLGRDMYAFVRPINKYIIMPVFDFFKDFILSFGLVIALLTIFIRLATSPLVYTSYLSGAKMKALRPEIDLLKQKFGNDQQQIGIEQMKLFREAGVNPLGGCIPALLQIPIFFALYSFFNSNIALRGQSFLWAENLASYDAIIHFPINIWGLGNHLSLFTLTAAGTSFLISLYSTSMTPDSGNPALKYMPYIFPFILIFIFNRLPSALTWYYTVSNVITIILQWIIQNYIIDHDKILAKIEANRKKPKTKSKWQEKFDQMQESQRKLQDMKNKGGKK